MSRSRATRETILTEAPGLVGSTVMNVHFSEGRGVSLELGAVVGTHRRSGRPMREFSVFIGCVGVCASPTSTVPWCPWRMRDAS
jgi:hypothetical protein